MRRPRSGFALVEVVLAAGLTLVALGAVVATSSTTLSLWGTASRQSRLEETVAGTLARIAEELRFSDSSTLVVSAQDGSSRLDFRVATGFDAGTESAVWSSLVTWVVSASPVDADGDGAADEWRLERQQDGASVILCDHLPAGGFTALSVDGRLDLTLTLVGNDRGRAIRASATTAVTPRNRS